jgi:predicted metalloendopeptidase
MGPVKIYKFQLERATNGRLDMEQTWKECINVVENELPYAIGFKLSNDENIFRTRNLTMNLHENIRNEFINLIANESWIDNIIRGKLLNKLHSLTPLIAQPKTDGFDDAKIMKFYDEIKINRSEYIETLLRLRIIDADNKFSQTCATSEMKIVNDIDNWRKYLPPTSHRAAVYSQIDNTLRNME